MVVHVLVPFPGRIYWHLVSTHIFPAFYLAFLCSFSGWSTQSFPEFWAQLAGGFAGGVTFVFPDKPPFLMKTGMLLWLMFHTHLFPNQIGLITALSRRALPDTPPLKTKLEIQLQLRP